MALIPVIGKIAGIVGLILFSGCQVPENFAPITRQPAQIPLPMDRSCLLSIESGEELLLKEGGVTQLPSLAELMKPLLLLQLKGIEGGSFSQFQVGKWNFSVETDGTRCYLLLNLPNRNPFSPSPSTQINCRCKPLQPHR
ncbi:MAG: hypothetical protein ABGW77_03560 [Campylobacterales bacterium]